MVRALEGRLVIATHNAGKLAEMRELLDHYGVKAVSAGELGLPEPEETGSTFLENSRLKALAAAEGSASPALADDSGLCVDALGGEPGIYSARWAGPDRDFGIGRAAVEEALRAAGAQAPFKAHFICVLTLAFPDGETASFEGRVDGELVFPARGSLVFGYDPIFLPVGLSKTFGEMTLEEKQAIPANGSPALSHRARAFQAFAKACFSA
ncbi:RdgB/HAM1 family non-canonical purine NTP pyrophosphatase [Methylocella silvestris]|uniref:dITP/XTP pyrophosphatase n=1 Tax=Methylocella silvestris TaxID=199596 RepID=A0A2J7THN2_METSI|nr:RdgB/HAM1 family non-canonical purine NTP pyrophosphatase [Methylocella silvestris]PNG26278.1 non-canonical purine NTP pyrophosphatase, RdgB/HAM1 family [Methylocella silvestris]